MSNVAWRIKEFEGDEWLLLKSLEGYEYTGFHEMENWKKESSRT